MNSKGSLDKKNYVSMNFGSEDADPILLLLPES